MPIPRSKEAERVAHEAIEKHGLKEAAHQLGVPPTTLRDRQNRYKADQNLTDLPIGAERTTTMSGSEDCRVIANDRVEAPPPV